MKEKQYDLSAIIAIALVLVAVFFQIMSTSTVRLILRILEIELAEGLHSGFFIATIFINPFLMLASLILSFVALYQIHKTKQRGSILVYVTVALIIILWIVRNLRVFVT
jgi:hypothetical protein